MAKDKSSVLNEVLVSLATEAAQDVEGVHLLNSKRNCGAVSRLRFAKRKSCGRSFCEHRPRLHRTLPSCNFARKSQKSNRRRNRV